MQMSKRMLWALVTVGAIAALPLACKKDDPDPNTQFNATTGQYGYGTAPTNTAYGAAGYGAAPYNTATATPTATQPTATATATGGQPDLVGTLGGMVGGMVGTLGAGVPGADPISAGIQYNANQNAPGMKAEGSPIKLQLNQGQTSEGQVTLQSGKCYTLVGASLPGVIDVAVRVTPPAPLTQQTLGQNETTGPMPVVWPKDKCYRNPAPMPIPVRVEVTMKQGAGMVGIQPYSK
jgi:hypothetical protein